MRNPAFLALCAVLSLAGAVGCGSKDVGANGDLVGGRCVTDVDCRKRCLQGGDFPGGFCSVSCLVDADCPSGTVCIDKMAGVCLLPCAQPADCQFLGAGYKCDSKDRKSAKGVKVPVCIGE